MIVEENNLEKLSKKTKTLEVKCNEILIRMKESDLVNYNKH